MFAYVMIRGPFCEIDIFPYFPGPNGIGHLFARDFSVIGMYKSACRFGYCIEVCERFYDLWKDFLPFVSIETEHREKNKSSVSLQPPNSAEEEQNSCRLVETASTYFHTDGHTLLPVILLPVLKTFHVKHISKLLSIEDFENATRGAAILRQQGGNDTRSQNATITLKNGSARTAHTRGNVCRRTRCTQARLKRKRGAASVSREKGAAQQDRKTSAGAGTRDTALARACSKRRAHDNIGAREKRRSHEASAATAGAKCGEASARCAVKIAADHGALFSMHA
eukprot:IDg897t1